MANANVPTNLFQKEWFIGSENYFLGRRSNLPCDPQCLRTLKLRAKKRGRQPRRLEQHSYQNTFPAPHLEAQASFGRKKLDLAEMRRVTTSDSPLTSREQCRLPTFLAAMSRKPGRLLGRRIKVLLSHTGVCLDSNTFDPRTIEQHTKNF